MEQAIIILVICFSLYVVYFLLALRRKNKQYEEYKRGLHKLKDIRNRLAKAVDNKEKIDEDSK